MDSKLKIKNLVSWASDNKLFINPIKTFILNINQNNHFIPPLFLCDKIIKTSTSLKLLGITFTNDLKFNNHFMVVIKSARMEWQLLPNSTIQGSEEKHYGKYILLWFSHKLDTTGLSFVTFLNIVSQSCAAWKEEHQIFQREVTFQKNCRCVFKTNVLNWGKKCGLIKIILFGNAS